MNHVYAVVRTRGAGWQDDFALERQREWDAHAAFMDGLEREGFVVLAGPLDGTRDALLVVRASSPDDVHSRLAEDPWTQSGLLVTRQVSAWTLRIGARVVGV